MYSLWPCLVKVCKNNVWHLLQHKENALSADRDVLKIHWIEGNCGTQQHVLLFTRHYTFVFLISLIAAVLCFLLRFCNPCNVAAIKEKCSAWYICMVNKHLVWKDMITTYFTTLFLLLKNKILIASNINNVSATTHL